MDITAVTSTENSVNEQITPITAVEEGEEIKAIISEDGITAVLIGDADDDTKMVLDIQEIVTPYSALGSNTITKAVTLASEVTTQTGTNKNAYAMTYLALKYTNEGSNGVGGTNKVCKGISGGWNLINKDAVLSDHEACWWFTLGTTYYADIDYANLTFKEGGNAMPSARDLHARTSVNVEYGEKTYKLNLEITV